MDTRNRVLVVCAHPDDETLWAGGYLLANPGTHVLCCTVTNKQPSRITAFFEACYRLGAKGIIAGCAHTRTNINLAPAIAVAREYESIITHNVQGEYGHIHHQRVHQEMSKLDKDMMCFGYGVREGGDLIDYQGKMNALHCYPNHERILEIQRQRGYDLSRERLVDRYAVANTSGESRYIPLAGSH